MPCATRLIQSPPPAPSPLRGCLSAVCLAAAAAARLQRICWKRERICEPSRNSSVTRTFAASVLPHFAPFGQPFGWLSRSARRAPRLHHGDLPARSRGDQRAGHDESAGHARSDARAGSLAGATRDDGAGGVLPTLVRRSRVRFRVNHCFPSRPLSPRPVEAAPANRKTRSFSCPAFSAVRYDPRGATRAPSVTRSPGWSTTVSPSSIPLRMRVWSPFPRPVSTARSRALPSSTT